VEAPILTAPPKLPPVSVGAEGTAMYRPTGGGWIPPGMNPRGDADSFQQHQLLLGAGAGDFVEQPRSAVPLHPNARDLEPPGAACSAYLGAGGQPAMYQGGVPQRWLPVVSDVASGANGGQDMGMRPVNLADADVVRDMQMNAVLSRAGICDAQGDFLNAAQCRGRCESAYSAAAGQPPPPPDGLSSQWLHMEQGSASGPAPPVAVLRQELQQQQDQQPAAGCWQNPPQNPMSWRQGAQPCAPLLQPMSVPTGNTLTGQHGQSMLPQPFEQGSHAHHNYAQGACCGVPPADSFGPTAGRLPMTQAPSIDALAQGVPSAWGGGQCVGTCAAGHQGPPITNQCGQRGAIQAPLTAQQWQAPAQAVPLGGSGPGSNGVPATVHGSVIDGKVASDAKRGKPPVGFVCATGVHVVPISGEVQDAPRVGRKPKDVAFNVIASKFNMPIDAAARDLGVCTTVIKKVCRQNGVQRWPYRRIRSVIKPILHLQAKVTSGQATLDEIGELYRWMNEAKRNALNGEVGTPSDIAPEGQGLVDSGANPCDAGAGRAARSCIAPGGCALPLSGVGADAGLHGDMRTPCGSGCDAFQGSFRGPGDPGTSTSMLAMRGGDVQAAQGFQQQQCPSAVPSVMVSAAGMGVGAGGAPQPQQHFPWGGDCGGGPAMCGCRTACGALPGQPGRCGCQGMPILGGAVQPAHHHAMEPW